MVLQRAYFDTSVLMKRYVQEDGSAQARALLRRYRFLSSAIAPLEALSAIYRRHVAGEIADQDLVGLVSRIQRDRGYWELIEMSPEILARAEQVIKDTTLRTLDAIHVASVILFQSDSGIRVPLITADWRQREGARRLGLDVIWLA